MNNKRVLFVHDGPVIRDEENNYYGVSINDNLVQRYNHLGKYVTLIIRVKSLNKINRSKYKKISSKNFNIIEIPNFKSPVKFYFNFRNAKKIIHNAVREHDIIVGRLPSAAGTLAVQEARINHKPCLVEYVACTFDAYWNYNWQGKLIAHYKMYQQKRVVKDCTHVIYVTREFLQNRYPTKGKSISCSNVELKVINPEDLRSKLTRLKKTGKTLTIGTVAALDVPYKGQADVIQALARLKKKGIVFNYKLVGQGDPTTLQGLINKCDLQEQVEIIGALKHDDVFRFLVDLDLYIQPSKQEGLPRALIEAMSKACPALGARTAGIPELLEDEYVFEPGSVEEIMVKLENINYNWLAEQAQKNFETSKEYQKDILEERRLQFYQEFLIDYGL
ncbi:MAG: glycosyltransferase [Cyclobacteriaceae bacterium]|nr:glycosyltransferase [Cyclobacteriaceae bacterium]